MTHNTTKKYFFAAIALFLTLGVFAQSEQTIFKKTSWNSSGGWGGYRQQITRLAGNDVTMIGFFMGSEYDRKWQMNYHFNFAGTNPIPIVYEGNRENLRLNWHALQVGYVHKAHKAVHPVVDMDFGIGRVKVTDIGKERIFVLAPGAGLEINLWRWMHLYIGGGYRLVTDVDLAGLSGSDLSGAFGQFTVKFGWSETPKTYRD